MKIFIPFKIKEIGGVSTFAKKFKTGLERAGHKVIFDYEKDYDVLFLIVQCEFKYIFEAKIKRKKIIQRLDGCWYWSVSGWKYWLYNLKAKIIYKFFADFVVFQSQYSRYCCEKFLGKNRKTPHAIIYNGVDLDIFNPEGEKMNLRENPEQKIFFTASAFRREDQIIPIINALEAYKNKFSKNFKLIVAGNFTGKVKNIPEKYKNRDYIKFIGKIDNQDLPKYERGSDVFLFTHLNPPCPNNIIEAMACGLPICGVADGAMTEITKPGKNSLLVEVKGDSFWKTRKYNYEKFSNNLNMIYAEMKNYSKNSRLVAEKNYSIEIMIKKYLKII